MLTYAPKHWSQVNMSGALLEQRRLDPGSPSSQVHISGSSSSISTYSPAVILLASLGGMGGRPSPTYTPVPSCCTQSSPALASDATDLASSPLETSATGLCTFAASSGLLCRGIFRKSGSFGTSPSFPSPARDTGSKHERDRVPLWRCWIFSSVPPGGLR